MNIHVRNVKRINSDYYNYIYKSILEYFYYSSISNKIQTKDRTEIVKFFFIFFANNIVINNLIYSSNNLHIYEPLLQKKSFSTTALSLSPIVSDEEDKNQNESINVNNDDDDDDEVKFEEKKNDDVNNDDDEFSSIDINDLITLHD